jgi:D-alanyl-D-alanine carboxypeptidase (penicillin-binding protein 5/6)
MQDFPEYLPTTRSRSTATRARRRPTTPTGTCCCSAIPTVDGLKTGHTDAAGYCLIATAKRDFPNLQGPPLLSIVLGASSEIARANESQKLLNWGYHRLRRPQAVRRQPGRAGAAGLEGHGEDRQAGPPQPIVVAVPAGSAGQIKTQVARPDPLVAPFSKGQQVGTLKVLAGDQPLRDVPLVALRPVEQAGIFGRAWDADAPLDQVKARRAAEVIPGPRGSEPRPFLKEGPAFPKG